MPRHVDWRPAASSDVLKERARMLAAIRDFMFGRGLLEVDTPVLVRAAPAERGLKSFGVEDVGYLVPSPEHAMKRLLAAGSGPIYQLGHVFRAGESGRWHNPEFCMLEWYRPHADHAEVIDDTVALLDELTDTPEAKHVAFEDVFRDLAGVNPLTASVVELADCAAHHGVAPSGPWSGSDRAFWLDLLMSLVVQPVLGRDGPVCVNGFPADDAVLVECDPEDSRRVRRFEFYWRGVELANGAQELTDAAAARERLARENTARCALGERHVPVDEPLLDAMEAGLPQCAGVALGVDRLLALMCGFDSIAPALAFDWPRR